MPADATPLTTPLTVGILAFDDMEVLDFAGPYEVFNVAGELGGAGPVEVRDIGVDDGPVRARGGFTVLPHHTLADAPACDVVVVPGGLGARRLLERDDVLAWTLEAATTARLLMSVCSGSLVLAAAGLLEDARATSHHTVLDELRRLSPTTTVVEGRRFVQAGERLWTSAGVSAGVDLALHVVELLLGEQARAATVAEMEWGWGS